MELLLKWAGHRRLPALGDGRVLRGGVTHRIYRAGENVLRDSDGVGPRRVALRVNEPRGQEPSEEQATPRGVVGAG